MLTVEETRKVNEELARRIGEEAQRDPASPYAGKIVGLANGRVVVAAGTWDEVERRLDEVEPDPLRTYCVAPNHSSDADNAIWELA